MTSPPTLVRTEIPTHRAGPHLIRPPARLALSMLVMLLVVVVVPVSGDPAGAQPSRWRWPLSPRPAVVREFDPPSGPYGSGHRGVDLLGHPGEPVLAVASGRVRFAGQVGGIDVVSVFDGIATSTYEPVAAVVRPGQRVRAGQVIGRLGVVGGHCLPQACLHLGRIENGQYLDPLALLPGTAGPVRLLPLDRPFGSTSGESAHPDRARGPGTERALLLDHARSALAQISPMWWPASPLGWLVGSDP